MTWEYEKRPIPFEENWRMDFEYALRYGVDCLWFFEADASKDGPHVRKNLLRLNGFPTAADAHRRLLELGRRIGM